MSTEHITKDEAKKKLKAMVTDIRVAMFATQLGEQPLSVVPMHTKEVDKEGNIWFLSRNDSDHNNDLLKKPEIQLLYSDPNAMKFLSVYGLAEIITDQAVLDELYNKKDNAWFDGAEDPNLTAIKFYPKEAAYWDNNNNKLVTFLKLQAAAVTGDDKDIGTSGKMDLR
ncbi:pyridoxamine 5'-phosphate oxidase family protein [Marixanthomonas spongiae]|uniref:General stress protein n=1 Tax=Marixanthomonas spongiae TaxID=2174845 RepID=A0A2U0I7U7_9FLAO|nr:pyridoxamine 5'-phosphate oxidase family protein [Marixanthomonas spongiae]PVW17169.1 general stress protein [Marixanthomonas spongiae]